MRPVSRITDARQARARTLAALNQGAGLLNDVGHSHAWQWAVTDPAVKPSYLLGLYDVDALVNGDQLPIVLEMTCLTSAFQQPAYSGTTIDERLVLHPHGGVIATWGPTGLGIAHGHDALQRGFYRALWSKPAGTATLDELTLAGYRELFTRGSCCQDTLRTFALLGDPLTRARVQPLSRVWMPSMAGRCIISCEIPYKEGTLARKTAHGDLAAMRQGLLAANLSVLRAPYLATCCAGPCAPISADDRRSHQIPAKRRAHLLTQRVV